MKILIAIPAFGGNICEKTVTGIYQTTRDLVRQNVSIELITVVNDSLIHQARSNVANFFYHNTDATHLLWVDADIGFTSADVQKLIDLQVDFAAATYPKKVYPLRYTCKLPKQGVVWNEARTAIEVAQVGNGFQLLTRAVFERIKQKFPELKYTPRSESRELSQAELADSYHYYDTYTDKSGLLIGEDYAFCNRYRTAGGQIWLRPDIALTHVGSHVFTGQNLLDILDQQ